MPDAKLSLHRKLAEIVAEVSGIGKTGEAPRAMGGYSFAQIADVQVPIRRGLAKRNLTMLPVDIRVLSRETVSVVNDEGKTKSKTTVDLGVHWRITDGDTEEFIEVDSFGAGADSGDKYSGKALTNAMKYALLLTFLLPTGDDPEKFVDVDADAPAADGDAPKPRSTRGRKATPEAVAAMTQPIIPPPVFALASDEKKALAWARSHEAGLNEQQFKALTGMLTKKEHSAEWTTQDVDRIVEALGTPMAELFKNATFPEAVPAA